MILPVWALCRLFALSLTSPNQSSGLGTLGKFSYDWKKPFLSHYLHLDILLSFMILWPLKICRWSRSCVCIQTVDWITIDLPICSVVSYFTVPRARARFSVCLPYCSISFVEILSGTNNVHLEFGVPVDRSDACENKSRKDWSLPFQSVTTWNSWEQQQKRSQNSMQS